MKHLILTFLMLLILPLTTFALAAVDLNTASVDQLEALPGVGKKTADAIVAARPYKSVDDLKGVKGIGDAKFAKLKSEVTVSGASSSATAPTFAAPTAPPLPAAAMNASAMSGAPAAAATAKAGELRAGQTVNVNTASLEELDRIPGIGPAKAKAIVVARPFASVEDLTKVKGIKQATLEKIRPFVTVH